MVAAFPIPALRLADRKAIVGQMFCQRLLCLAINPGITEKLPKPQDPLRTFDKR